MATYTVTDGSNVLFTANMLRGDVLMSRTRGGTQTLRFAFASRGNYLAARAYTAYTGASSHGRTLGGEPWYIETLTPDAPVTSNVVLVEVSSGAPVDDFWCLFTDAVEATPPPGIDYAIDFDVFYLAPGDEFDARDEVEDAYGTSITA